MSRRPLQSRRRRSPATLGVSFGFLRPPRRHEEEQERFVERLRNEPELRREYRSSLIIQLTVVGALTLAVFGFLIQAIVVVRRLHQPAVQQMGWVLPVLVGCLGLLVLRRFLRLWADYRALHDE